MFFSAAVNVRFGRPNVTVNESDGEFMMCVVKDRDTAVPVTVIIVTRSGTATEGMGEIIIITICSLSMLPLSERCFGQHFYPDIQTSDEKADRWDVFQSPLMHA
jgi:hypothetical protein